MMSAREKRTKGFVALLLGIFVVAELPFARAWVNEQGGMAGASRDFLNHLANSPIYQATAIDLTGVATLLFIWMVLDARKRLHPWRAWLWLPLFLFSPSLGAFGYLLTRRGDEEAPEASRSVKPSSLPGASPFQPSGG
jgi:ABC-type Fe3+ transport system permease subunit